MIAAVFLLGSFLVFALPLYWSTGRKLEGDEWLRDGPSIISNRLQSRNRTIVAVVALILFILAALESFIPELHFALGDIQYAVGDRWAAGPQLYYTFQSGGGLSLGLYLAILFGVASGVLVGTWASCRRYGATGSLPAWRYI